MPFSIIIPQDADFFEKSLEEFESDHAEEEPRDVDWDSFYWSLSKCSTREVLFHEETFSGFIIHTGHVAGDGPVPPKTVFLSQISTYEPQLDAFKHRDLNPGSDSEKQEITGVSICEFLYQGIFDGLRVSIWKFVSSSGQPQGETSGKLKLQVSWQNPHLGTEKDSKSASPREKLMAKKDNEYPKSGIRMENLLEELNHSVLGKPPHKYELYRVDKSRVKSGSRELSSKPQVEKETGKFFTDNGKKTESLDNEIEIGTLAVALSAPLQLKLRTTKPGGCGDILLTALRIEAPEAVLNLARNRKHEKYVFHILGLDAKFKNGQITPLGNLEFPRRCELNEVISVTYKLENDPIIEQNVASSSSSSSSSSTKAVDICVRVRIESTNMPLFSKSSEVTEWRHVTTEISTTWTPILDFFSTNTGSVAPIVPAKIHTPRAISQSQVRSKSTHLKPSQVFPHKSSTPKSFASASVLPIPGNSPYTSRPTWPNAAVSPNPLRPVSPHKSSPILSVSRGGVARKKTQRSLLPQMGNSSSVTVNLAGESSPVFAGLRLTFTGDPKVELGHITSWKVQAVNQTSRVLRLVLTADPVSKNVVKFSHLYPANSARSVSHQTVVSSDGNRLGKNTALQSRLQLYEQYNMCKPEKSGVVLLSNDIGLGVLEPNQVFESEFSFMGVSKGIFNLNGLRILESSTGEVIEIGRVLEVYVM